MQTYQLLRCLRRYENFKGVYPKDYLNDLKIEHNDGYVINTDSSDKPGEHWVAAYFPKNSPAEYFDSFGFPPLHSEIINFMNGKQPWIYNDQCLQSVQANSCGYFCYLFLVFRFNDLSMRDFIDFFTKNTNVNELLLKHYHELL